MRKLLVVILALSILFSMASFVGAYANDEVIFSESFENGKDNWSFNGSRSNDTNAFLTKEQASDGKTSACVIDADDKSYGFISNKIPCTAGVTYTVTYDSYTIEGMAGKIFAAFFNEGGERIQSTSFANQTNLKVWETMQKDFVAPDGATTLSLYITGSGASTGKNYVDNIKVTSNTDGKPADPKPADPKPSTPAPSTPSANVGEVIFSESFENGIGTWVFNGSKANEENTRITSEKASDGKYSAYLKDPDDKVYGYKSAPFNIEPGVTYNVSYDLFNIVDCGGKVFVAFFDAAGTRIESTSFNTSEIGVWKSLAKDFTAPEAAVQMAIYLTNSGAATGESYADNIKVIKKEDNSQAILAAKEIKEKINVAKPGDVIEIPDGKYESRIDVNVNGTEDKPIIIKAKNPGKAVFTNKGCMYVSGSYIIIEDLLFEECNEKYVFMFNEDCTYSQIRNCAFLNNNPLKDDGSIDIEAQQKVVLIKGAYNKVSNCYFRGKSSVGQMAEIIRTTAKADYHIIENCYFGDFKEGPANGYETVRIGTSPQSLSSSFSTLRGCFFEKCNGEVETVSIKSCDNYIYNNTLYNTSGAIVLRHGNNSEVKGNLVIGGDPTTRVTGIRVIGENHKVYDNYFYNTPAKSDVLYISNGNPNPLIHEYLEVKNADVHNNTFINADSAIIAGEYLPSSDNASNRIIPPQGKIYNNAIISYKGYEPVVSKDTHATELILENNYVEGKKLTEKIDGVIEEEIGYTVVDNFIVPNNNLGANIEEVKKAPKSPFDVMPLWVKEQYYDTGKIKFDIVANDPFNNPDLKADDIFPKEGKINVILNGNVMKFDVDPQLINDRTMVPMRAIFEGFNATVSWDEATATATASTMTTTIKVTENSDIAYVNGAEHKLDSPAVIIDGRFLVPVRFISESFGATVKWIDETQTVDIEYVNQNFNGEYVSQHPNIAKALTIYSLIESGNDGGTHIPNVLDGSFASKWAFKETEDGGNGYGIFDLGSVKTLDKIYLANLAHKTRVYSFEIYVSEDGKNYTLAIPKTSATKKDGSFEAYDLNGVKARYVKYSGFGNNDNSWNNLVEVLITEK